MVREHEAPGRSPRWKPWLRTKLKLHPRAIREDLIAIGWSLSRTGASRGQLWWGHQIPAWYVVSETDGLKRQETPFVVARDAAAAQALADAKYGQGAKLAQEEDVLDTWFSSALWPFSTLGWPDKTPELAMHYPTDVLVTDRGIIYFWVVRSYLLRPQVPGEDALPHRFH